MAQLLRITIEKLIHGGAGLGVAAGKKLFVPFAAPGDVLDVAVTADHGSWAEAEIDGIVEPAACRVTPRCPVFGRCGGCQWQHLAYGTQLAAKKAILAETLERIGKIAAPNVLEPLPSPKEWNYRNRVQLHVDSQGHVGFYQPKSKEVVEFAACAIADERINAELHARRAEIAKRDRGIALRVEEGGGSFAQVNSAQNEQLKGIVAEWIAGVPHGRVLELYAGSGNFTFAIAKIAGVVVASDVDKKAVEAAQKRAKAEKVCNADFMCAPAGKAAHRFRDGCDAVLVDPPRAGCAEAIEAIVAAKPRSLLYISCDPATLARDARTLAGRGYRLEKSLPVDMFPQTFHVESLNLFLFSE